MEEKDKRELVKRKADLDSASVRLSEAKKALDRATVRYIEEKIKSKEESE